jgi:DNA-binding CsgD family transcriptional regulator
VLKNADGLELKFGRFLFENVTTQAEFERAVRVAAASIGSDIAAAPYKIRVTRRSVGSPFALAIVPVHTNADRALMPEGAACMILIHDLDRVDELPLDRLSWLYRLTPAEARICESLYRMGSIDSAAQDLSLTRNTVRSHLKSIYGKFGVATQGQLIQRLANSVTFNRSFVRDRLGTS